MLKAFYDTHPTNTSMHPIDFQTTMLVDEVRGFSGYTFGDLGRSCVSEAINPMCLQKLPMIVHHSMPKGNEYGSRGAQQSQQRDGNIAAGCFGKSR